MVNSLLVMAAVKSIEETLIANDIPFGIESSEAYKSYQWEWVRSDKQQLALRQAAPAIERILANEPYVFEKGGEPLFVRVNDKMRGNKLLRNMFKEATLIGDVYYLLEERKVSIFFRIKYKQCEGGSNGMELGTLIINTETGITEWREF